MVGLSGCENVLKLTSARPLGGWAAVPYEFVGVSEVILTLGTFWTLDPVSVGMPSPSNQTSCAQNCPHIPETLIHPETQGTWTTIQFLPLGTH